jgi:hypothetical protein
MFLIVKSLYVDYFMDAVVVGLQLFCNAGL